MISRLTGKVVERGNNRVLLETGYLCYEVLIPTAVMQRLDSYINADQTLSLVTYHYLHVEPSRSIPILIGFLNEVERDFFEIFITVSGIGPRGALRALQQPISMIAKAIDSGDTGFLKTLPGIGQQRAKEIVAKLQNKVGKFALMQDGSKENLVLKPESDIVQEAVSVLMQLQYKKPEAVAMIKAAMDSRPEIQTTEDLLNTVYKLKKVG